ncbi:hypothetical protein HNV10_05530 [Winogradskyella litoriviva]|uniref:Uncharacterized protein n=1 Tax=Winogradskyella litoriviva TaxID=1220182 RepID=A0ABX2E324_9FLAO|nr:hypothetical protein [Winogradskyella litoriviva]NRD22690.1 hypothetical protein [Winogradskyella litoriviva]
MSQSNNLNNTKSKEWLSLITEILAKGNSLSTKYITEVLGTENTIYKRNQRGSKFLRPKNKYLSYIAINPDLEDDETDQPISFLVCSGEQLNLKLKDLLDLFPNMEIVENTYDGGIQLFFHPVNSRFNFTAVACQLFTDYKKLDDLKHVNINEISFMFQPHKIKTRAGYSMSNSNA